MATGILVVSVLLALASVLPWLRAEAWWIRVFDFPRVQILVLGVVAAGLTLLWADVSSAQGILALGAAAAAVVIQVIAVLPYTPVAPVEVRSAGERRDGATLSLLVANVLMDNRNADPLLRLIGDLRPDVILLLEPDAWWERALRALEGEGYVHTVKEPRDNKYGMLLYARLSLLDAEIRHLLKDEVPSIRARVRLADGDEVWLYAVHPEPPAPAEASSSLPRDAELLMVGREVCERRAPAIVAGDLNDVAWSHTTRLFQKISRLLDPRRGRGMFNTFHAKIPFLRWPLDHVFHSDHFLLVELRRLPAFGSDHFPVYVRLLLTRTAAATQEAPRADADDEDRADDKVAKGRGERAS